MSDIAVENYKRSVEKVVDRWRGTVAPLAKELVRIDEQEIQPLERQKPQTDDGRKKLDDARARYVKLRKQIETANTELRLELLVLQGPKLVDSKNKDLAKALEKLPDAVQAIIKAKGVPLGKGVTVVPDIKFDFKSGKLKEALLKVTWRF